MEQRERQNGFSGLSDMVSENEITEQIQDNKGETSQELPSERSISCGNEKGKKGFSALAGLASDVSHIEKAQTTEPQKESELPKPGLSSSPIDVPYASKKSSGIVRKLIFCIIAFSCVLLFLINGNQKGKNALNIPSSLPTAQSSNGLQHSSVATSSNANEKTGLQYSKPPAGTNNVLSVPEIHWCLREDIRIESMRGGITSQEGIAYFNQIVDDYNSRCVSYRYYKGSKLRAERDIEPYRNQIIAEAIQEASLWGKNSFQSVLNGGKSSASKELDGAVSQEEDKIEQIRRALGLSGPAVKNDDELARARSVQNAPKLSHPRGA